MDNPILNIESVGCQHINTGYISTYYIPSLTYKIHKWFKDIEKTIYIPILFNNENNIKNIFTHYNNIYFKIQLCAESYYGSSHYSQEYHISKLIDFNKLINKEFKEFNWVTNKIYIHFIIKYNNYNISIIYFPWDGFNADPTIKQFNIFENINNTNILKCIKTSYYEFPQINCYTVYCGTGFSKNFDSIKESIDFIDELIKEEEKIDSLYSKKSYKLVEE